MKQFLRLFFLFTLLPVGLSASISTKNPLYQVDGVTWYLLVLGEMPEKEKTQLTSLAQQLGYQNTSNFDPSDIVGGYLLYHTKSLLIASSASDVKKDMAKMVNMVYIIALSTYNTPRQRLAIYRLLLQDDALAQKFLEHESNYEAIVLPFIGDLLP
jgi:hypothetical protein